MYQMYLILFNLFISGTRGKTVIKTLKYRETLTLKFTYSNHTIRQFLAYATYSFSTDFETSFFPRSCSFRRSRTEKKDLERNSAVLAFFSSQLLKKKIAFSVHC